MQRVPTSEDEPAPAVGALLERHGLALVRTINRGGWGNGDVYLVERGARRMVLKTYVARGAPIRLLGRFLLRRERRAYRLLTGVPGVPRLEPLADDESLLLDFIEARRISDAVAIAEGGERIIASLARLVDDLHARGVFHMDLRSRGNLLVDAGHQVFALDFASAVILRRRDPLSRLLAAQCRRLDLRGVRKWAERVAAPDAPGR